MFSAGISAVALSAGRVASNTAGWVLFFVGKSATFGISTYPSASRIADAFAAGHCAETAKVPWEPND